MSFRSEYLAAQAAKTRQSADPAATREASLASMKRLIADAGAGGYLNDDPSDGFLAGETDARAASKASMMRELGRSSR